MAMKSYWKQESQTIYHLRVSTVCRTGNKTISHMRLNAACLTQVPGPVDSRAPWIKQLNLHMTAGP